MSKTLKLKIIVINNNLKKIKMNKILMKKI